MSTLSSTPWSQIPNLHPTLASPEPDFAYSKPPCFDRVHHHGPPLRQKQQHHATEPYSDLVVHRSRIKH